MTGVWALLLCKFVLQLARLLQFSSSATMEQRFAGLAFHRNLPPSRHSRNLLLHGWLTIRIEFACCLSQSQGFFDSAHHGQPPAVYKRPKKPESFEAKSSKYAPGSVSNPAAEPHLPQGKSPGELRRRIYKKSGEAPVSRGLRQMKTEILSRCLPPLKQTKILNKVWYLHPSLYMLYISLTRLRRRDLHNPCPYPQGFVQIPSEHEKLKTALRIWKRLP